MGLTVFCLTEVETGGREKVKRVIDEGVGWKRNMTDWMFISDGGLPAKEIGTSSVSHRVSGSIPDEGCEISVLACCEG